MIISNLTQSRFSSVPNDANNGIGSSVMGFRSRFSSMAAKCVSVTRRIAFAVGLVAGLSPTLATASDQIPGKPQSQPIAIVGATLHTVSGPTLKNATVLFEDGKITAVADQVELPDNCRVISAPGKHVYPGLIDAHSDLGLVEINSVRATLDSEEVGSNNANVRAAAAFNSDSEIIPVNRANGVLMAVTAPEGRRIAGRGAMMLLDGWTWEDMTLKPDVGMYVHWSSSDSAVQQMDETIAQTRRYLAAREQGSQQPRDLRLEALGRVVQGEMPMVIWARTAGAIQSAVGFTQRHGIRMILIDGYHALSCAELLRKHDIPVIVSAVYRLPSRRHAAYDEGYTFPARLQAAGIRFCISAGGRFGATGVRNLPYNAATAAAYGLDEAQALQAITLSTAEIFGVADRVGSLDAGKDATLFIADGDILETPTQVEQAFIQGRVVDLDNRHKQLNRKYSAKYARGAQ